jgi:hypothetical protein
MNPHQSTEQPSSQPLDVNDALRALRKAINDAIQAKEGQDDYHRQISAHEWERAHAELWRWKSFACDAWMAACSIRDTATRQLDELKDEHRDLLGELQEAVDFKNELPF